MSTPLEAGFPTPAADACDSAEAVQPPNCVAAPTAPAACFRNSRRGKPLLESIVLSCCFRKANPTLYKVKSVGDIACTTGIALEADAASRRYPNQTSEHK